MILTCVSAFAADPTGSITVKPSSTVSLEGKILKAYKILDATYSGTAIAYTIPAALKNFYDTYFGNGTDTASTLAAADGKTVDYYVTEKIAAFTTAELKDFEYAELAAAKTAGVTGTAGSTEGSNVKFSPLAAGYYVIETKEQLHLFQFSCLTLLQMKM